MTLSNSHTIRYDSIRSEICCFVDWLFFCYTKLANERHIKRQISIKSIRSKTNEKNQNFDYFLRCNLLLKCHWVDMTIDLLKVRTKFNWMLNNLRNFWFVFERTMRKSLHFKIIIVILKWKLFVYFIQWIQVIIISAMINKLRNRYCKCSCKKQF